MKIADLQKLTVEEMNAKGYQNWDGQLRLIPERLYHEIDDGEELIDIFGARHIKGKDRIDIDTRGGMLAYGFHFLTPK